MAVQPQDVPTQTTQVADPQPESVTVVLSGDALAQLKEIASRYQISIPEAVARAISRERTISEEIAKGGRVLIEKADKSLRGLVLEP